MYNYKPKKSLLAELLKAEKKGYNVKMNMTYAWHLACQHVKEYRQQVAFLQYWKHTNYYSKTRLTHVPVQGVMLPVDMFDETEAK